MSDEKVTIEMLMLDAVMDGERRAVPVRRIKLFVLGRAKMQMRARGVVELADGTVRVLNLRHTHNPEPLTGALVTVGEPMPSSFDAVAEGLWVFEGEWITSHFDTFLCDGSEVPADLAAFLEGREVADA